jgi:S-adenosyl methyltransferase
VGNITVMATQEDAPGLVQQVDPNAPSLSRIYDHLLGGGHNFASDRATVAAIMALALRYDVFVHESRAFVRRVVLHMLTAGIEQFLDLGEGLGRVRPVHELAQARAAPGPCRLRRPRSGSRCQSRADRFMRMIRAPG